MDFLALHWHETARHLASVAAAYVLALPLGWEREKHERSAGLRTFPLVAMASCGYVLIWESVLGISGPGHDRIIQGLMTGMGSSEAGPSSSTAARSGVRRPRLQ